MVAAFRVLVVFLLFVGLSHGSRPVRHRPLRNATRGPADPIHSRLVTEPGLQQLIDSLELATRDRWVRPCTRVAELRSRQAAPDPGALCLEPWMLKPPPNLKTFRGYLEDAIRVMPGGYAGQHRPFLGGTFPYLSPTLFRFVADVVYDSSSSPPNTSSEPPDIQNRSLVHWNLRRGGPDIVALQRWLAADRIAAHFFLVSHGSADPSYPIWLLDHPRILRVFGTRVPSDLYHPKLTPLPEGLLGSTRAVALLHSARIRFVQQELPTTPSILLSHAALGRLSLPLNANLAPSKLALKSRPQNSTTVLENLQTAAFSKFVLSSLASSKMKVPAMEAYYFGRVPLVIGSQYRTDALDLLPVAVFPEVKALTAESLNAKWRALQLNRTARYDLNAMWGLSWLGRILRECLIVP